MAINRKLYPDTAGEGSVRADVREEPSRDQPPRDSSSDGSLKTVSPVTTGGIITTEVTDFSILGHQTGNICPICGTRVPALLAKAYRNPGKGFKREFACTQCADFGVSPNPAFWGAR